MEGIEDQLENLNKELFLILEEIKDSSNYQRVNPSRLSLTQSDQWDESSSEKSNSNFFKEKIENKVEELLQALDQKQMIIEDFRSDLTRKEVKLEYSQNKISELILKLNQVIEGNSLSISIGHITINFANKEGRITLSIINKHNSSDFSDYLVEEEYKKTDASSFFESSIENEEVCAICGIDSAKLRLKIETEIKQRKSEIIETEKANFEKQLEELDMLKENYIKKCKDNSLLSEKLETQKKTLEKKELVFATKKYEFEKKKQEWEKKIKNHDKVCPYRVKEVFRPDKYSQEELEKMLLEAKLQLESLNDSKTLMKIDQIENQLSRYRTEKAILESNKLNARVIYSLFQTFDKELIQDLSKKKLMIEKTYGNYYKITESKEKAKVDNLVNNIKTNEEIALQLFEKKYELLAQKEKDLLIKEKNLENSLKKINIIF